MSIEQLVENLQSDFQPFRTVSLLSTEKKFINAQPLTSSIIKTNTSDELAADFHWHSNAKLEILFSLILNWHSDVLIFFGWNVA